MGPLCLCQSSTDWMFSPQLHVWPMSIWPSHFLGFILKSCSMLFFSWLILSVVVICTLTAWPNVYLHSTCAAQLAWWHWTIMQFTNVVTFIRCYYAFYVLRTASWHSIINNWLSVPAALKVLFVHGRTTDVCRFYPSMPNSCSLLFMTQSYWVWTHLCRVW